MKTNEATLYPNEAIGNKVLDYCHKHSTTLPPKITDYHTHGLNHERSGYMISPIQSQFQVWIAKALGAKRVLEIGTFIGYSAMTWAEAAGPDGFVTTLELSPEYAELAKAAWKENGYSNIEVLVGPAIENLEKLAASNPEPYDLVFIDADKSSYPLYLETVLKHSQPGAVHRLLRSGGTILADNVLRRSLVVDDTKENPNVARVMDPIMQQAWKPQEMIDLRKYNKLVFENERLDSFLLPLFDGVNMARLKD